MKKYFVAALLLFAFVPAHSLTLTDMISSSRRNMIDTEADAGDPLYTDAQYTFYLNEGQREVSNMTWLCEKTTSYVLSAGTSFYALPSDFIAVVEKGVTFTDRNGSSVIELEAYSRTKLTTDNPAWKRQGQTPAAYWISQSTTSTALQISFIPVPTSVSTGTVTLQYINQPADMSSGTDIPFDGRLQFVPYHQVLSDYATLRLKALEGKYNEVEYYQARFELGISIIQDRIGRAPNSNPSLKGGTKK